MKTFEKISLVAILLLSIGLGATVFILLKIKGQAESRLAIASQNLRELGEQYIDYVVHVDQEIPLKTEVTITRTIPVDIEMLVNDSVLIQANVHVNDSITVPVSLNINEILGVDTTIQITRPVTIQLNTEIPINQKFAASLFRGRLRPSVPIEANVPLDQPVTINFTEPMYITSDIRARLPIRENLRVPIMLTVPMNQRIPLVLPIRQQALVSFTTKMPIEGMIPIVMDIPVKIPLRDTPIKLYLDRVADQLEDMLAL